MVFFGNGSASTISSDKRRSFLEEIYVLKYVSKCINKGFQWWKFPCNQVPKSKQLHKRKQMKYKIDSILKRVTLLNSQRKPDSGMAMSCSGILITRSINSLTFAGCNAYMQNNLSAKGCFQRCAKDKIFKKFCNL
jgi:hypothetical protein